MFAKLPQVARLGNWCCLLVDFEQVVCVRLATFKGKNGVNFGNFESRNRDIEVTLDVQKVLKLDGEYGCVPAGLLCQSIVGDDISSDLIRRQVFESDRRHFGNAKQLGGRHSPVSRDYRAVLVDEDRIVEAESPDAVSDLADLPL